MSLSLVAALALAPLGPPQESRALFDAPLVELDSLNRMEELIEYDGTPGYEAVAWWWTDEAKSALDVRVWDIDPVQGFALLWELNLPNPSGTSQAWPVLVPADVDGGVGDDLIVINDTTVRVHRRIGQGAPQLIQTFSTLDVVTRAFAADLDADGFDDLVAITKTGSAELYRNDGTGASFSLAGGPQALAVYVGRATLGELTGDAIPDLLFTRQDAIVIQPLAADFSFPAQTTFPLTAPFLQPHPTTGDIDGDGDEDAVIFATGPSPTYFGEYTVLRRDGPSSFTREAVALGGPATDLVDLDGDGDLDGACCGGGGGPPPPDPSLRVWENRSGSRFELCHNDGSGAFTPAFELVGLGASQLAGAVDVDFDGDVDLVAGRVVYYAPGPVDGPLETGVEADRLGHELLTDCDADGDPDVSFALEDVGRSDGTLHLDTVTPTMAPPVNGLVFEGPGYAGDFDGDGDSDLLVAKWKTGTFRRMRLLENAGGGHLIDGGDASDPGVSFSKTGNTYLAPGAAWSIDWDGDGDVDLFTWGWASNPQTSYWENDGTGYFVEAFPMNGFHFHVPHGFGDFDGDSITDVLTVVGDDTRTMNVLLGDGTGGATPGPAISSAIQPFDIPGSIAVDDFDNDGDLDLVVCDQDDELVGDYVLLLNDGLAGFTPVVLEPPGPTQGDREGRAVAADVNADGWSDVIVSALDTGLTSSAILLRNPDGVLFQPMFEQIVRPFDAGDVDGDGDVDLVDGSIDRSGLANDRVVASRLYEGAAVGARVQVGAGVPGSGGAVPWLGASGPFRPGERFDLYVSGAAPGITGRLIIGQVGTGPAAASAGRGGTRSSLGAVSQGVQVIDFVTSGAPSDPVGSGHWSLRRRVSPDHAGRTLLFQVELDDTGAVGGQAATNPLYVHFGEELN